MNPRYLAYCAAHGLSPDGMMEHDRAKWPGGVMCGFILWMNEQWPAWKKAAGWRGSLLSEKDHASFDAWLDAGRPSTWPH